MPRKHGAVALALIVLLLAGCTSEPVSPATMESGASATPEARPARIETPPLPPPPAENVTGGSAPTIPRFSTTTLEPSCPGVCYEPSIAIAPDGTLYVTDTSLRAIRVSRDGGVTFSAVEPPPVPSAAPTGADTFDELVQIDPAQPGRLYWSALVGTITLLPTGGFVLTLTGVQVAASDDGGQTWTRDAYLSILSDPLTRGWGADRQWLAFGPDGVVYVAFQGHTVIGGTPIGVGVVKQTAIFVARSDDAGASWTPFEVALAAADGSFIIGTPAVTASGRLLVPAFEYFSAVKQRTAALRVAISDDAGATFTLATIYESEEGPGAYFPRLLSLGGESLLATWRDADLRALVAVSADDGETWSEPVAWSGDDELAASPWAEVAGGDLVVAWFTNTEEATASLTVARAPLGGGVGSRVVVAEGISGSAMRPASTEFPALALSPDGLAHLVWTDADSESLLIARETDS